MEKRTTVESTARRLTDPCSEISYRALRIDPVKKLVLLVAYICPSVGSSNAMMSDPERVVTPVTEIALSKRISNSYSIADEVNLTACNVDYLLVIEVRNRYLHSSFQISLVKELSKQEVCPVLANIPRSTRIAYVCYVKSLAKKEQLVLNQLIFTLV